MNWQQVLTTLLTSSIIGGGVSVLLTHYYARRALSWEAKRDACLHALEIVDAVWAHIAWVGVPARTQPQARVGIAEIRRCHSLLVVTCDDPEIESLYVRCMHVKDPDQTLTADVIAEFRDAIRKELGLGKGSHSSSRERAWLSYVPAAVEVSD